MTYQDGHESRMITVYGIIANTNTIGGRAITKGYTAALPKGSGRSSERAVDHLYRVLQSVNCRERAKARAFLLPEQHLVEHVEPFQGHARLAVLGLGLASLGWGDASFWFI